MPKGRQNKGREIKGGGVSQVAPVRRNQVLSWLAVGSSLVTLFIWSNLADPFNAPKSWVMYVSGCYLAGWVVFQIKGALSDSVLKLSVLLSGAYVLVLFGSVLV